MPGPLKRLHSLITRGLDKSAHMWPDIQRAYGWVHRAAHLLANTEGHSGEEVSCEYETLLDEMRTNREEAGSVRKGVEHFLKVTGSYWPGLFHCYDVPDLPPTDNDLEHCFGSARHHERRATGRKHTSSNLVVRGKVRLLAAVALTVQPQGFTSEDLRLANPDEWWELRTQLDYRHETRRAQFRFRKNPDLYLATLEEQLLMLTLPP